MSAIAESEALHLVVQPRIAAAPSQPPKTGILLIGQMRNYDTWLPRFLEGMVTPNSADVFIHAEAVPQDLAEGLGDTVKDTKETGAVVPCVGAECQFWHLQEAWKQMEQYETLNGFKYDVVVKARTEVAPMKPSYLDLAGWEEPGRIHMMTDMLFWGPREDMHSTALFYEGIQAYYKKEHPDAFQRPIAVKALLDSLVRDVRLRAAKDEDWRLYNKLETLPYPDMGLDGAVANLKAAVAAGMTDVICDGKACNAHCGDRYKNNECKNAGDYRYGEIRCEKDLLDWIISRGITICDVGASMVQVYDKGKVTIRSNSSDCAFA